MMKQYTFIISIFTLLTFSCKAQTIIALEDPNSYPNATKPILRKDVNNIRDSFIGVWQGIDGNKELTIYLYNLDGVPVGIGGLTGNQFKDGVMGYYIYKESGVVIINSRDNLLNPHVPNKKQYGPIFGFTRDGIEMTSMRFVDYGIEIPNQNGTKKRGHADFTITNVGSSTLQATFKLSNKYEIIGPYNYDFSLPENLTLTKISNTPPTLD